MEAMGSGVNGVGGTLILGALLLVNRLASVQLSSSVIATFLFLHLEA